MSFTVRELQSASGAAGNIAAGPDDNAYSIIRQMPDVAMATLLALCNAIWTQGKYTKPWKEAIVIPLLKVGKYPENGKLSSSIFDVYPIKVTGEDGK